VIRQLCAVADWYGYSWEKEPWQQLLAHGAVLYLADREAWDNRIQRVIDDLRGKDDEPAAAAASPESLTAADLQLLTAGDYNTITASYTYMPGAATPAVVVQNNGSHNTISVAVQPFEEEEEEE
jgi:hypothetical protein